VHWTFRNTTTNDVGFTLKTRDEQTQARSVSTEPTEPPKPQEATIGAEQLRQALHKVIEKFPAATPGIQWLVLHLNGREV